MTLQNNKAILTSEDIKEAHLTPFMISLIKMALDNTGYELVIEKTDSDKD